jgi:small-conductance mechanosensitive channel
MAKKNEARIHEVHERLMHECISQISGSICNFHRPDVEKESEARKHDPGPGPATKEIPMPLPEEHSGPDKINEIRHEVAAAQLAETSQSMEILNPDRQKELMEIVKQRSEKFERELRRLKSLDNNAIESAAQKFKDELMDNVRKQLTDLKYTLLDL